MIIKQTFIKLFSMILKIREIKKPPHFNLVSKIILCGKLRKENIALQT